MTKEGMFLLLGEVNETYVAQAARPKGHGRLLAALAACAAAVLIVVGTASLWRSAPGGTPVIPGATSSQEEDGVYLAINKVSPSMGGALTMDMDVTYSDYTNLSQEEQAAAQEGFQSKLGISYEDFTARLPQGFSVKAFASLNARTSPEGDYVPHDYIFTLSTPSGGSFRLAFSAGEAPLRDCLYLCDNPLVSRVGETELVVYQGETFYQTSFSQGDLYYDLEGEAVTQGELGDLLRALLT